MTNPQATIDALRRELATANAANLGLTAQARALTLNLQEARAQQAATADVLKAINQGAFDPQAALEALINSAVSLSGSTNGVIWRFENGAMHARAFAQGDGRSDFIAYMRAHPQPPGRGSAVARVALTGQVQNIADVRDDSDYSQALRAAVQTRATLGVPMKRGDNLVGAIVLSKPEAGVYSDPIVELTKTFADQAVIVIENLRLFAQVQTNTHHLEQALKRQTTTSEILRVISQSPTDARPVFESIVVAAARLLQCDMAFIMLVESDRWRNVAVATPQGLGELVLTDTFPVDPALNFPSRAIVAKDTVYLADWSEIELPPHQRHVQSLYGFRSSLHLPLLREEECVGVLTLLSRRAHGFGETEIAQCRSFRDQASIAMENARLFNETQESLAQQTATADVLKTISRSAFDLQKVLDTLVASAATLCQAEKACIFQRRGDLYHWESNFGFSNELVAYAQTHPFGVGGGSTTSRVVRDRLPIHIPDVLADPDYKANEYQRLGDYRTMLGVPLLRDGEPVGVFIMTRRHVRPFNARQIELLQTFSDQAVIAIENARLFDEVQSRTSELEQSLADLRRTQDRLVQSEKLASLGQLTAGIAHEIKNPLNFVNNFASLSRELLEELREALRRLPDDAKAEADDLMGMIDANLEKVVHHGKRADSIVKNMLLHSREGSGERACVNVNAMVEEALNLGYHGARAENPGFQVTVEKALDPECGEAKLYLQEITRVLLNLITNGFYATAKRREVEGPSYQPTLKVSTRSLGERIEIRISDNGAGVPDEVRAKMFNPFFTTKPAGEGTGLGLSLSHDIVVKQHGGTIEVETEPGEFAEFIVTLPRGAAGA